MPCIAYKPATFRVATMQLINKCNDIIDEYIRDGYTLTLRQLYYQLVSRDVIANSVKEYNRLGNTVSDARLAGLIDWDSIEDRGRNLQSVAHWTTPNSILHSCSASFRIDKWSTQSVRPEVWIEKEALAGVFQRICNSLDVPYIACKGYMSQSEMWAAAMRYVKYIKAGKTVEVFHFGDHDPSGIDMSRDIEDRLRMFISHHIGNSRKFNISRIALNMDQVEQYNPPENPAKSTDTRFAEYQSNFGDASWELDALEPRVLAALVNENILEIRDESKWETQLAIENEARTLLEVTAQHWEDIADHVEEKYALEIDALNINTTQDDDDAEENEE